MFRTHKNFRSFKYDKNVALPNWIKLIKNYVLYRVQLMIDKMDIKWGYEFDIYMRNSGYQGAKIRDLEERVKNLENKNG